MHEVHDEVAEDWEILQGSSSGKRLERLGSNQLKFIGRLRGNVQSVSGANHDVTNQIKRLGRDVLHLQSSHEEANTPFHSKKQNRADLIKKYDSYLSSESDSSDSLVFVKSLLSSDLDISNWTVGEIEQAMACILTEIESSILRSKRDHAIDMVLNLMMKHVASKSFVEKDLERIVYKCLPPVIAPYATLTQSRNLSRLLFALTPYFGNLMSHLDVSDKVCTLLCYEINHKVKTIQIMIRKGSKCIELLESQKKIHWTRPDEDESNDLINILIAQINPTYTKMSKLNIATICQNNGIFYVLKQHILKKSNCYKNAFNLLKELAKKEIAIPRILDWGIDDAILQYLSVCDDLSEEEFFFALQAIKNLSSTFLSSSLEQTSGLHVEHSYPKTSIVKYLFEVLKQDIWSPDWDEEKIFPVIFYILIHFSFTKMGYIKTLSEVTSMGGRCLHLLVQKLSGEIPSISFGCHAFLKQLSLRGSGRDGMISCKIISMMMPDNSKDFPSNLVISLIVSLSHCNIQDQSNKPNFVVDDKSILLHIYEVLLLISSCEINVSKLISIGCLDVIVQFLVNAKKPSHFFDLPLNLRLQGSIILYNLLHFIRDTNQKIVTYIVKYFSLTIDYIHDIEKNDSMATFRKQSLIQVSFEAALWGLYKLCWTKDPKMFDKDVNPIARKIIETMITVPKLTIIKCWLSHLNTPNQMIVVDEYESRLRITKAAAALVSSILIVPETEYTERLSIEPQKGENVLERIEMKQLELVLKFTADALVGILYCCEKYDIIAIAIDILIKLSSTQTSCDAILELNLMGRLYDLFFVFQFRKQIHEGENISSQTDKRNKFGQTFIEINRSIFRLVANIARTRKGRNQLISSDIYTKCRERFFLTAKAKKFDQAVKGEIALIYVRMADTTVDFDSETKFIYELIKVVQFCDNGDKRVLYNSLLALEAASQDKMKNLPTLIAGGTIEILNPIFCTHGGTSPMLRPVLTMLLRIASFPQKEVKEKFVKCGLHDLLIELSNDRDTQAEFIKRKSYMKSYGDMAMDILFALSNSSKTVDDNYKISTRGNLMNETKFIEYGDLHDANISVAPGNHIINNSTKEKNDPIGNHVKHEFKNGINERNLCTNLVLKSISKTANVSDYPFLVQTRPS